MLLVDISLYSKISGFTAVIGVIMTILFSALVFKKALKDRSKNMLYFGIAAIIMSEPWWPYCFGYIYWIVTQDVISYEFSIVLANVLTPFGTFAWIEIYAQIIKPSKKKTLLTIFLILALIFWIYLFSYLFFVPDAPIYDLVGLIDLPFHPFDIQYKGFIVIFQLISLIFTFSTGLHFALNTMRLEGDKFKKQGIFMLSGWACYCGGAFVDAALPINEPILILVRTITGVSTVLFYIGFIFPSWARKMLRVREELEQN